MKPTLRTRKIASDQVFRCWMDYRSKDTKTKITPKKMIVVGV